jgi:hypothetical protein
LTRERQTVNAIKDFYFGWRNWHSHLSYR